MTKIALLIVFGGLCLFVGERFGREEGKKIGRLQCPTPARGAQTLTIGEQQLTTDALWIPLLSVGSDASGSGVELGTPLLIKRDTYLRVVRIY